MIRDHKYLRDSNLRENINKIRKIQIKEKLDNNSNVIEIIDG